MGQEQMIFKFIRRSHGDAQETGKLGIPAAATPLGDVRGDRGC